MTRAEIIEKGERQLQYALDNAIKHNSPVWASMGLHQLDMLYYILDEEYENYDKWHIEFTTITDAI